MVAFPVHQPRTPATWIRVRPRARGYWPTVGSQHEFRGATVRLKQLAGPWESLSGFPPLLSYLAGNPGGGGDRLYGPPLTAFRIGTMPVAHGGHFYGKEGGAAIAHMALLDLVVTRGRLGPTGLRYFLTGLSWADGHLSPARYRRPLCEWAWALREQREMWSWPRAQPWPHRLKWIRAPSRVDLGVGLTLAVPTLPGFRLECVGREPRSGGGLREVRLYYRPTLGHFPLVVLFGRATDLSRGRSGRIYRTRHSRIHGYRAVALRAPSVGSSRIAVDLGGTYLVMSVPAALTSRERDRDLWLADRFVRGVTGLG